AGMARTPYETWMRKIAAAILIAGLAVSAVMFAIAPAEVDEEQAGPHVINAANSKQYQRDLQRIGGKAAVVAAEFNEWFDTLWHGRRLAGTLAVISVAASLLCLLAAKLPPLDD
ncbi:MAG: hypothetical protein NTY05_03490, partial [Rhodocyclales bacterium]|nr:hypothetical protein [Rhodocyclales bacterium]